MYINDSLIPPAPALLDHRADLPEQGDQVQRQGGLLLRHLILVILLIMGVIQTGAGDGLYFLFQSFSVWRAAAGQVT